MLCRVNRLNSELFPTLGNPTMPIFRLFRTRPNRAALASDAPSSVFFFGDIALLARRRVSDENFRVFAKASLRDALRPTNRG